MDGSHKTLRSRQLGEGFVDLLVGKGYLRVLPRDQRQSPWEADDLPLLCRRHARLWWQRRERQRGIDDFPVLRRRNATGRAPRPRRRRSHGGRLQALAPARNDSQCSYPEYPTVARHMARRADQITVAVVGSLLAMSPVLAEDHQTPCAPSSQAASSVSYGSSSTLFFVSSGKIRKIVIIGENPPAVTRIPRQRQGNLGLPSPDYPRPAMSAAHSAPIETRSVSEGKSLSHPRLRFAPTMRRE